MRFKWLLLGAFFGLGLSGFESGGLILGALAGFALGHAFAQQDERLAEQARRLHRLEALLTAGTGQPPATVPAATADSGTATAGDPRAATPAAAPSPPAPPPDVVPDAATAQPVPTVPLPAGMPAGHAPPRLFPPHRPSGQPQPPPSVELDPSYARFSDWLRNGLTGGNLMVRLGLLILFFGLAFLARYAVEHSLLPPWVRLAGFLAGGSGMLALGWRLRHTRPGYGLSLQGGGVAVMYLTLFAAFRLYGLIEGGTAFALMLALVGLSAGLAIRQDSLALAMLGSAGGFATPILASTGSGSHVALFSYYAVLNAGIVLLAWRRGWRALNLLGFLFTFVIALVWGAQYYQPPYLSSTEPFLILHWLMYVAAALLQSAHPASRGRFTLHGTLVFGVPVAGFALQAALVHALPHGLAWSAFIAGALYLGLGLLLHRHVCRHQTDRGLGFLGEAFVGLGVAFLTLSVPLALDGQWTAATWALEGAAIFWSGRRGNRTLPQVTGLLLQLGAGASLLLALPAPLPLEAPAFAHSHFLGGVLLTAAGLLSAYWLRARPPQTPSPGQPVLELLLLGWALGWWLLSGLLEIDRLFSGPAQRAGELVWPALSGLALALAIGPLGWGQLKLPALLPLPAMLASLLATATTGHHPGQGGLPLAWLLAGGAHFLALQRCEATVYLPRPTRSSLLSALPHWHTLGLWTLLFALTWALAGWSDEAGLGAGWRWLIWFVLPSLALSGLSRLAATAPLRWPVGPWPDSYLGAAPRGLGVALLGLSLLASLEAGTAHPWPWLPLANPLETGLIGALIALAHWQRRQAPDSPLWRQARWACAFVALNVALLRGFHHLDGVAWSLPVLLTTDRVQAGLSLLWGSVGLVAMILASRCGERGMWVTGAFLMGAVAAKLFLIDMANSGTIARIVSFIGAGLLMMIVGYFSPLPPSTREPDDTPP